MVWRREVSPEDQMRLWAIRRAAVYRDLFRAAVLRALPVRWFYRWLFADGRGGLSDPGERVLSDLRDFCHASDATIFYSDPLVMARREGRRGVHFVLRGRQQRRAAVCLMEAKKVLD